MTATNTNTLTKHANNVLSDVGIEGDIDGGSSDGGGDTAELKQRKKELILAKQLERRQQQELIRLKREEERARKAEELRLKEEEIQNKKLIEKVRKETIFQAYIDKKKQVQEESQSGQFGSPNPLSLLNAKRFHSTHRLKQNSYSSKPNGNLIEQQHQQQAKLMMDQFDQASLYSDRSANTNQQLLLQQQMNYGQPQLNSQMIKSKYKILNLPLYSFFSIYN